MDAPVPSKRDRIRTLNDLARSTFTGCAVVITPAVQELSDDEKAQLLGAVRQFDRFDADNDPHHEHDFGAIDLHGQKWFWKFDYYAPDLLMGSDDPADTDKTHRVLTIMHASEY
jgi:uncharacterized protein DUF3768